MRYLQKMRSPRPHSEKINVPDWPSDANTVSVYFKDYAAKEYKKPRNGK